MAQDQGGQSPSNFNNPPIYQRKYYSDGIEWVPTALMPSNLQFPGLIRPLQGQYPTITGQLPQLTSTVLEYPSQQLDLPFNGTLSLGEGPVVWIPCAMAPYVRSTPEHPVLPVDRNVMQLPPVTLQPVPYPTPAATPLTQNGNPPNTSEPGAVANTNTVGESQNEQKVDSQDRFGRWIQFGLNFPQKPQPNAAARRRCHSESDRNRFSVDFDLPPVISTTNEPNIAQQTDAPSDVPVTNSFADVARRNIPEPPKHLDRATQTPPPRFAPKRAPLVNVECQTDITSVEFNLMLKISAGDLMDQQKTDNKDVNDDGKKKQLSGKVSEDEFYSEEPLPEVGTSDKDGKSFVEAKGKSDAPQDSDSEEAKPLPLSKGQLKRQKVQQKKADKAVNKDSATEDDIDTLGMSTLELHKTLITTAFQNYINHQKAVRYCYFFFETERKLAELAPIDKRVIDFWKSRLTFNFQSQRKKSEATSFLVHRCKHYKQLDSLEGQKMDQFLQLLMRNETFCATLDIIYLQNAPERILLKEERMIYERVLQHSNSQPIYSVPSVCELSDFKDLDVKFDTKYLTYFVSYLKRQAELTRGPQENYHPQEKLMYAIFINLLNYDTIWTPTQINSFIDQRLLGLSQEVSTDHTALFVQFYTFLKKIRSMFIDVALYWYSVCIFQPETDSAEKFLKNDSALMKLVFGFETPESSH